MFIILNKVRTMWVQGKLYIAFVFNIGSFEDANNLNDELPSGA